jgi:hypothetical protein
MRLAITCGNRNTNTTTITAVQKSTKLVVLRFTQVFRKYIWKNPKHKRTQAAASSHGRNGAIHTLMLANPNAPTKPNGTQQANVESAATIAAAGAPFSKTFIHCLPAASLL